MNGSFSGRCLVARSVVGPAPAAAPAAPAVGPGERRKGGGERGAPEHLVQVAGAQEEEQKQWQ